MGSYSRVFPRGKRRGRRERGQSLVEFALVIPVFLIIVMGIIDLGMGIRSWISITNAAREAARYGAVYCSNGEGDAADVENRAIDSAPTLGLIPDDVAVTNCAMDQTGESVTVTISYDYELVTPLGGMLAIPSTLTLTSSSDMRLE
jgi:Flp pilus assembly protein TadG